MNLDGVKENELGVTLNTCIRVRGRPQKKLSIIQMLFTSHQMHNTELHQAHMTNIIIELARSTFQISKLFG